jgi:hypothetical protein
VGTQDPTQPQSHQPWSSWRPSTWTGRRKPSGDMGLTPHSAHPPGPAPPHGSAPTAPAQPPAQASPAPLTGLLRTGPGAGPSARQGGWGAGVVHVSGNSMQTAVADGGMETVLANRGFPVIGRLRHWFGNHEIDGGAICARWRRTLSTAGWRSPASTCTSTLREARVKYWRCDSTDRSMTGTPASLASPRTVFRQRPPTLQQC